MTSPPGRALNLKMKLYLGGGWCSLSFIPNYASRKLVFCDTVHDLHKGWSSRSSDFVGVGLDVIDDILGSDRSAIRLSDSALKHSGKVLLQAVQESFLFVSNYGTAEKGKKRIIVNTHNFF